MYVIVAPIQIKQGHKDEFIEAMLGDARGSVNDEPGCLRFDVIQDGADPNRIWLYEVYVDEAAFQAHTKTPHFLSGRDRPRTGMGTNGRLGAGPGAPKSGRRTTA